MKIATNWRSMLECISILMKFFVYIFVIHIPVRSMEIQNMKQKIGYKYWQYEMCLNLA